jgi:TonB family protein
MKKCYILTLVLSFIVFSAFSQGGVTVKTFQSDKADTSALNAKDSSGVRVEISATFKGGDINVFHTWVQKHLIYPRDAVEQGIDGNVYIKFSINDKGILDKAEIYNGVHELIDNEALRAVLSSPPWEPFVMPVTFRLR